MKHLILGGARSGKSRFAETQAHTTGKQLVYVATGSAGDTEMAERIDQHQQRRGSEWLLVEEPLALAEALSSLDDSNTTVVVDCLTLWLSNCLAEKRFEQEKTALLAVLPQLQCDVLLVSNEVGSGVVPLGELSRQFVDASGWLHQSLAPMCDRVTLVMAGLPLSLKNGIQDIRNEQ